MSKQLLAVLAVFLVLLSGWGMISLANKEKAAAKTATVSTNQAIEYRSAAAEKQSPKAPTPKSQKIEARVEIPTSFVKAEVKIAPKTKR